MNQQSSRLQIAACVGLALLHTLAACAGLDPKARVPDEHIVMVNYRGKPVDPTSHPWLGIGHYRPFKGKEFDVQLARVIGHIDEYARGFKPASGAAGAEAPPPEGQKPLTDVSRSLARQEAVQKETVERGDAVAAQEAPKPRVVIFIHGGLNTQAGSVARAVELHKKMLADGVYPVFVNWQSSLVSSYWDHLFLIRYGEEHAWQAWLSAPFLVGADLLRAIGRAPLTIFSEVSCAFTSTHFYSSENQRIGARLADDAPPDIDAEFPERHRDPGSGTLGFARDVVLMLPHMVLGILVDIGGRSSWEVMHRRTTLIMEPENSYRSDSVAPPKLAAIPRLFTDLRQLQDKLHDDGIELQVDIICHSMGCIISNLLLETVSAKNANGGSKAAPEVEALPRFTNIVYMANADSVQKTERAVYPYLLGHGHEKANFFTLSLNDRAELAETSGYYLAPKGSLLIWIDRFFEPTPSMPDQRAGELRNQLFSMHRIPTDLRERVHLKSFRFESSDHKTNPVIHGDFSEGKFWRPDYFTPHH